MTEYAGIDYGSGLTNIDIKKGIRYGIIHQNHMPQWCEESDPFYVYHCPECNEKLNEDDIFDICPHCKHEYEENTFDDLEPTAFIYEKEGYKASSDEYGDIWLFESNYYTYAQFCSPCAPGACYLTNPLTTKKPENNKCYCFGLDWFDDDNPCPYAVYSIKTNKEVK